MRDSKTTIYKRGIRLTEEDYQWIMENKYKKSAAGFLKQILMEYRKPNLFNNKKRQK